MGALSLRLPASIHRRLGEVAEKEGVSINQLINSAVAEKMSVLSTVPDVEPETTDRVESPRPRRRPPTRR